MDKPMKPFRPQKPVQTGKGMGNAAGMALKMQMAQGLNKVIPRGKPQAMKGQPKKRGF